MSDAMKIALLICQSIALIINVIVLIKIIGINREIMKELKKTEDARKRLDQVEG